MTCDDQDVDCGVARLLFTIYQTGPFSCKYALPSTHECEGGAGPGTAAGLNYPRRVGKEVGPGLDGDVRVIIFISREGRQTLGCTRHSLLGGRKMTTNNHIFHCSGLRLCAAGQSGEGEGVAENISQSFPDGEHDPAQDEPQLLPHGAYKSP